MTEHNFALEMIISNGAQRGLRYRLRDLLILLLTWGGWGLLALQPLLNYLNVRDKDRFIASLNALEAGQLFITLLGGIFLLIHSWARYNKLLHRLMGKRTASKAP
ncbi:MAG: hypothetical protein ACRCR1_06400 [Aeromonas sp.]